MGVYYNYTSTVELDTTNIKFVSARHRFVIILVVNFNSVYIDVF